MPADVRRLFASALALEDQGRAVEALECYRLALLADPSFEDALHNRGLLLARIGRLEEAERSHRDYIAAQPGSLRARLDLADVLLASGRYLEAIGELDLVLQQVPGHVQALVSRGLALSALGRFAEARHTFSIARSRDLQALQQHVWRIAPGADLEIVLSPESAFVWRNYVAQTACDWRGWDEYLSVFRQIAAGAPIALDPSAAFIAFHLPLSSRERLAIARGIAGRIESHSPVVSPKVRADRMRLRIGILSPDLRDHVNAYLLLPLFELLDRGRFELYAYSLSRDDGSVIAKQLRNAADRFAGFEGVSDAEAASKIYTDEIDILVDVGGHTTGGRFGITARRPAPLQVSYMGFAGSLGSRRVDYAIVDRVVAPPAATDEWSEALVRLPHTYYLYDFRQAPAQAALLRREYGLPEGAFVYCAFHKAEKITPDGFDLWMRILRRVPASVLWLLALPAAAQSNLRAIAAASGVDPARLHFSPYDSRERYLARQRLGDLMVDTLHHSAMTTACDALGAGLPLLTLKGSSMASRAGESLLRAAGLPELIAADAVAYEETAVQLAFDKTRLASFRSKLEENRRRAPLFDTTARVRQLEAAFGRMHQHAANGNEPVAFDIAAI